MTYVLEVVRWSFVVFLPTNAAKESVCVDAERDKDILVFTCFIFSID